MDAMKSYVDQGLEKDRESASAAGENYPMPEFQKLVATAGKGLQRSVNMLPCLLLYIYIILDRLIPLVICKYLVWLLLA